MPVRKYRSIEELKATPRWYQPGSPEHLRALAQLWRATSEIYRARFPPGVYKHRSAEDADRLAEAWDLENFRRHQQSQQSP